MLPWLQMEALVLGVSWVADSSIPNALRATWNWFVRKWFSFISYPNNKVYHEPHPQYVRPGNSQLSSLGNLFLVVPLFLHCRLACEAFYTFSLVTPWRWKIISDLMLPTEEAGARFVLQKAHNLCRDYIPRIMPKAKIVFSQNTLGSLVGRIAKVIFSRRLPPFHLFLILFFFIATHIQLNGHKSINMFKFWDYCIFILDMAFVFVSKKYIYLPLALRIRDLKMCVLWWGEHRNWLHGGFPRYNSASSWRNLQSQLPLF